MWNIKAEVAMAMATLFKATAPSRPATAVVPEEGTASAAWPEVGERVARRLDRWPPRCDRWWLHQAAEGS